MRTTINVDEYLLIELKTVAAQSGRTLTAVIEDALRQSLVRRDRATPTRRPRLPTISGGGLQPGVDLDDNSALLDLMEGIGP